MFTFNSALMPNATLQFVIPFGFSLRVSSCQQCSGRPALRLFESVTGETRYYSGNLSLDPMCGYCPVMLFDNTVQFRRHLSTIHTDFSLVVNCIVPGCAAVMQYIVVGPPPSPPSPSAPPRPSRAPPNPPSQFVLPPFPPPPPPPPPPPSPPPRRRRTDSSKSPASPQPWVLPLEVVLPVAIGIVGAVSLAMWLSRRKAALNDAQRLRSSEQVTRFEHLLAEGAASYTDSAAAFSARG